MVDNYSEQLNSPEFASFLNSIIEKKIKTIVKNEMEKFGNFRGWVATVDSINLDLTANVKLAGDSATIIPNLKNKSGEVLIAGDEVYLCSISSLSNAYISIKK